MLRIETRGTWRDMGRQYGEEFREQLAACIAHYAPWLLRDPHQYGPAIHAMREVLQAHCPELVDETAGMAEAAGQPDGILLGYRLFNDVRARVNEACSVVYLADGAPGPLLGRNCDLSPTFDPEVQLCRVCRPSGGPATIQTTYLGMAAGIGLNEHGVGVGGASAHTPARYGDEGLPGAALWHLLLHECRDVPGARALMAEHAFLGKPCNLIAGDDSGASVLLEFAPGRSPVQSPRRDGRQWQACTNFFISKHVPVAPDPAYLDSAYARYGRIVHQLDEGLVAHTVGGLEQLLTDIAQPGLCQQEGRRDVRTAYSQVMDLKARKMHVCPGHPGDTPYEEVCL